MEQFSGGYYRAKMSIQPYDDGPVIESNLHRHISENAYRQTDAPITVRVGMSNSPYFPVSPEGGVPTNVLAIPGDWIRDLGINGSGDEENVFFLKAAHASLLNSAVAVGESPGELVVE